MDKKDGTCVRFARPEDIPQITAMAYKTYDTLGDLDLSPPDFAKILQQITRWTVEDVVLVYRDNPEDVEIQGVIMAETGDMWWSNTSMLRTTLFYVSETHENKGRVALSLVEGLREYSETLGISVLLDIIDKEENIAKIQRFLKVKGFTPFSVSGIHT